MCFEPVLQLYSFARLDNAALKVCGLSSVQKINKLKSFLFFIIHQFLYAKFGGPVNKKYIQILHLVAHRENRGAIPWWDKYPPFNFRVA